MNKFFAKKLKDTSFSFYENDINHIINVLRLKIGDELIVIFDSKKYICKITSYNPLLAKIVEEIPNNSDLLGYKIGLFQAIIKPKNFELVLTKSTELGVTDIYPVNFERSQENYREKLDRYNNIVISACKQSGRTLIPTISETINFSDLEKILSAYEIILVPNEHDSSKENDLYSIILDNKIHTKTSIAIIIGPEGGFTNDELEKLSCFNNLFFVGLTRNILRSETATFYTLSNIVSYLIYKRNRNE